jgi:D-hexose-6-phosphate mutarotase
LNTYAIFSGRTQAVISRTGGTILSFKVDGQNIFYPWRVTENGKARGGCPICAPWFGSAPFSESEKETVVKKSPSNESRYIFFIYENSIWLCRLEQAFH